VSRADARDAAYAALADPTRRAILELLRDQPGANAGQIAKRFPHISRPAVSKHLRVLREAELVTAEEQGREWKYQVDPHPLADIYYGWLQSFAPMWEESLDRLKRQVEGGPDGRQPDRRRQRRA
jgi:DNA-binding transcriptional ArsR family regulator